MGVTEVLGNSKAEIVVGVLAGVETGLNPNGLYGSDPVDFSASEEQHPWVAITPLGYVGVETTHPYTEISSMAKAVTEAHQPAAETGLALASAIVAAGLVRAVKAIGKATN